MYSLIIVDYNSIDASTSYIQRCWDALGKNGASHVVLVENGSNDGVLEKLSALYGDYTIVSLPDIRQSIYRFQTTSQDLCYCPSGENMGYARGNNLGVRIAKAFWNDPFYIVSNNDLVFTEQIDLSIATALFNSHPEIGAIGPQVITPDGFHQSPQAFAPAFRRLIVDYWRRVAAVFLKGNAKSQYLLKHCNDVVHNAPSGPCDWISGCFMLLRAEAFHRAGMFDENTFLYGEEMILSRRLESVGFSVWFCRDLQVIHKHAQTTKKTVSVMHGRELDFRSVWYYYKTYTNTPRILLLFAKWNFFLYKHIFSISHKLHNN